MTNKNTRRTWLGAMTAMLVAAPAIAWGDSNYTLNADFDTGVLNSVNYDVPDQLQLNKSSSTEPFIYIAQPDEGIVVKLDTTTGKQVGRYHTTRVADCPSCPSVPNRGQWSPSRTAVDLDGNLWVANRSFGVQGSIAKIGSTPAACIDRNMNGVIDTSKDANNDGVVDANDPAEFLGQNDECLLFSVPVGAVDAVLRALAVDANGAVYVGSYNLGLVYKVDQNTKTVVQTMNIGTNTYGFAIVGRNLHAAALGGPVKKMDLDNPANIVTNNASCNYGIAADRNGVIFFGSYCDGITRCTFTANGENCPATGAGSGCTGITVDGNGDVWGGCYGGQFIGKFANSGTFLGRCDTPGYSPYGVAIAADGRPWGSSITGDAVRCDNPGPAGGPPGVGFTAFDTDYPGRSNIFNYSYSDMTGFQIRNFTVQQGSWSVVKDAGANDGLWTQVAWNTEPQGSAPAGTEIKVEVRSSNNLAALTNNLVAYQVIGNNVDFSALNITGRYLQVRVTLRIVSGNVSPVLSNVIVTDARGLNEPPVAKCKNVTVNADGSCKGCADINDGSYDPDQGDTFTCVQAPMCGDLGVTKVTLTCTDAQGASSSCEGTITTVDATPPMTSNNGLELDEPGKYCTTSVGLAQCASIKDNCGVRAAAIECVELICTDARCAEYQAKCENEGKYCDKFAKYCGGVEGETEKCTKAKARCANDGKYCDKVAKYCGVNGETEKCTKAKARCANDGKHCDKVAKYCEDGDSCPDLREVDSKYVTVGGDSIDFRRVKTDGSKSVCRYVVHYSATDGSGNSTNATCSIHFNKAKSPSCAK